MARRSLSLPAFVSARLMHSPTLHGRFVPPRYLCIRDETFKVLQWIFFENRSFPPHSLPWSHSFHLTHSLTHPSLCLRASRLTLSLILKDRFVASSYSSTPSRSLARHSSRIQSRSYSRVVTIYVVPPPFAHVAPTPKTPKNKWTFYISAGPFPNSHLSLLHPFSTLPCSLFLINPGDFVRPCLTALLVKGS